MFPELSTVTLLIRPTTRRRRGVALFAALVALLLLALLSIGTLHLGRGDFLRARDEETMRRAASAADWGAYDLMRRWQGSSYASMAVGETWGPDSLSLTGASAIARTTRTSHTGFWRVSTGSAGDSLARTLARRSVQVAFRLAIPDLSIDAALTVRDSVGIVDSARVIGTDTTLVSWGACAATPVSAIALPDTSRLCDGGCGGGSRTGRLSGLPTLREDSSAADSARYRTFGSEGWATLTRHAAVVLAPGAVVTPAPVTLGGSCDRSQAANWGAPGVSGSCGEYAPLIWARGDVELRGGVGQGVLLVDGDLTLSGGALFAGVVITRDDVRTLGAGGTVLGAVLAGDATIAAGDHTMLGGATRLQYSRCAVDRALERSARLVPVPGRSWAALRD